MANQDSDSESESDTSSDEDDDDSQDNQPLAEILSKVNKKMN